MSKRICARAQLAALLPSAAPLSAEGPARSSDDYQGSTLVDGKQRLEAVRRFMRSELPVFGGHVLRDIRGHLRLFNGRLKWRVVALESEAELLDLYLAINAGGTPHSPDEIAKVRAMRERLAP